MKRVIAGIYAYLCVLCVDLNVADRCDKIREHVNGSPLSWPNIRFFDFPLGLLLFIVTYGASAATQGYSQIDWIGEASHAR